VTNAQQKEAVDPGRSKTPLPKYFITRPNKYTNEYIVKMFQCVYVRIVSDNNGESTIKIA